MSIIEGIRSHYRLFGPQSLLLVARTRLSGRPREIVVQTRGISHPIHLRLRTTDISLFEEIILNGEYELTPAEPPGSIVDAGANIGLTSVYFANRFPQARILAIEPEQSNFEMLRRNAAYYPNIVPIRGALWNENANLRLSNPGSGNWGFRTEAMGETGIKDITVPGMTMDSLMALHGLDYIDLLKVDIEGAEKEVFEHADNWINQIGILMVELHDRTKNGCSSSVYGAARNFDLRSTRGETSWFVNKNYGSDPLPKNPGPTGDIRSSAEPDRAFRTRILSAAP